MLVTVCIYNLHMLIHAYHYNVTIELFLLPVASVQPVIIEPKFYRSMQ